MIKVLIVDDNEQITSILAEYAKKEGYLPLVSTDGETALDTFNEEQPDILLLDVMMPKIDGFSVCRQIRKISNVPIIMITARGEDFEKIMGLEIGADDYIVKPFAYDNLKINLDDYTASVDDKILPLTKKEIEILWTLATNKDRVFSRDNLLNKLWGYDYFGDSRTVDSHIKRLRAKLDNFVHDSWEIKTIWGVGYKFEVKA